MTFDSSLILRDGTIDLDGTEDAVPVIVLRTSAGVGDEHGAAALDIRKTGNLGLVAVMICPTAPTTVYQASLAVQIQDAEYYTDDDVYKDVASFPTLYSFVRKIGVNAVTTAFGAADIGQTLTASGTGTDTGTIVAFDASLETAGGVGDIYVYMDDSGDTYAELGDTLTSGGGGIGTLAVIGAADPKLSYGVYMVRFTTQKRYIRAKVLATASAVWGKVSIFVTNAGFGDL